jgi:hypothetical protein
MHPPPPSPSSTIFRKKTKIQATLFGDHTVTNPSSGADSPPTPIAINTIPIWINEDVMALDGIGAPPLALQRILLGKCEMTI